MESGDRSSGVDVSFDDNARVVRASAWIADVHWNEGAPDCKLTPQDPLQVHTYEPQTFILRQSPCANFEANFLYLLVGSDKVLLIDTGAVADLKEMPLAKASLPSVQVVPIDLDKVRAFFGFTNWPNGIAHVDLGGRTVDVIPTPGHNETHDLIRPKRLRPSLSHESPLRDHAAFYRHSGRAFLQAPAK